MWSLFVCFEIWFLAVFEHISSLSVQLHAEAQLGLHCHEPVSHPALIPLNGRWELESRARMARAFLTPGCCLFHTFHSTQQTNKYPKVRSLYWYLPWEPCIPESLSSPISHLCLLRWKLFSNTPTHLLICSVLQPIKSGFKLSHYQQRTLSLDNILQEWDTVPYSILIGIFMLVY